MSAPLLFITAASMMLQNQSFQGPCTLKTIDVGAPYRPLYSRVYTNIKFLLFTKKFRNAPLVIKNTFKIPLCTSGY